MMKLAASLFFTSFLLCPNALGADVQLSAKVEPCSVDGMFCIRLNAVNLSPNQSMKVAADKAAVDVGSSQLQPLAPAAVYKLLNKRQKEKKKRDVIAASLVTGGLASLTVADNIDKKRGNQAWLGGINRRRKTNETLFEDRVLLPLDHSDGLLYFSGTAPNAAKLRVPVIAWPAEPSDNPSNQLVDVTP